MKSLNHWNLCSFCHNNSMLASEKSIMTKPTVRYTYVQFIKTRTKDWPYIVLTTSYTFFLYFVKLFCKHYKRIWCLLSINKSKSEEFTYDEEVFVVELFDCLFSIAELFIFSFCNVIFCLYYLTIFYSNVAVMKDFS